jgi:hypothetical protein
MAGTKERDQIDVTNLGEIIGAFAVAQGIAAIAPRHEIKEGDPEYVARQHEQGWYDDFFGVTVLQNAYEAQARGLRRSKRGVAPRSLRPGSYLKGRVQVSVEVRTATA